MKNGYLYLAGSVTHAAQKPFYRDEVDMNYLNPGTNISTESQAQGSHT